MKNNQKIIVACSGGIDSVVLAYFLKNNGFNIALAHCNFQLRGKESDEDQKFVEKFAQQLNVELDVKVFDTKKEVLKTKNNTQITARNLRYSWFEELKQKKNARIALGHHKNDQVETFLIQLERNGGIRGLCAMLKYHNGYIRPLLNLDKSWIINYAKKNKLNWREDSSNQSNKYVRNNYRNSIISNLNISNNQITSLISLFQKLQLEVKTLTNSIVSEIIRSGEIENWSSFPLLIQKEILYQLDIARNQTHEISKLEHSDVGSFILLGKWRLFKERNSISIEIFSKKEYCVKIENIQRDKIDFTSEYFYIDGDKTTGKISCRPRKGCDKFHPLGMKNSKLVNKFYTDIKLSVRKKNSAWIIEDNSKIIAVQYGRPSELVKISSSTSNILRLALIEKTV